MINCISCGYQHGWTHKGGSNNEWVDGCCGAFFNFKVGFSDLATARFHGGDNDLKVWGCPSCMVVFMGKETYAEEK